MGIRESLCAEGFKFDKRYGQNFISDKNLLSSIVALAEVEGMTVVEIGVGAATLTAELCRRSKRVVGYEIDSRLRPVIEKTLAEFDNVGIIYKDFMKEKMPAFESACGEYAVVANLPYYITTPVIMRFMEEAEHCKRLVVMVQEEVAQRLAARENTPEYGAITAAIALKGDARIIKRVPRTMFYPVPNVDSAVVRIDVGEVKFGVDPAMYKRVVRAAFASRRKTLANNLMLAFSLPRQAAESVIEGAGLDVKTRGEAVSPKGLADVAAGLEKIVK